MSFIDLDIKREYRSLSSDVVRDFYTPALSQAVLYRRAVGFFSSSSLISLTEGIEGLIKNGGKIDLIASPRLSAEDLEAIKDGFERRNEIIAESLLRELKNPSGKFEEARLNLLANLIAAGILSIKIAFLDSGNEIGMYHEKLGIILDGEGNAIAFSGSMNETANAYYTNYESIDVYTSWSLDAERVKDKQLAFSAMWGDYELGISVVEFPDVNEAILKKYKQRDGVDLNDLLVPRDGASAVAGKAEQLNIPRIPEYVKMRPYQTEAISNWAERNYRGIFDMATGTGKTYTALAAVAHLSDSVKHNLAVVVVCPYQHLVEQWKDDIVAFGMKPIVCYSSSSQKNWRERVKTAVSAFRLGGIERFCIVTTNSTLSTDFMQQQLARLKGNCLIVADEAHNFGAPKLFSSLPDQFPYRLALSATIERYGDEVGTSRIFSYFGDKCIEYSLEDAIAAGMLTPYYYHPVVVALDGEERASYLDLSRKIGKAVAASKASSKADLPESVKMLLIKRARIVAGANSKVFALKETIKPFKDDSHILVYCGATTLSDPGYEEGVIEEGDARQIDVVSKMLGKDLGMKVSQFTSAENSEKRELLKEAFSEGKQMQALVAIRCLDEGVNIPSIEKAFILASSTNPKEYVQRRGRVLRTAPGKKYAHIYDFITLPIPLDEISELSADEVMHMKSLPVREILRMRDFASISENPADSVLLISDLIEAFGITEEDEKGEAYV